MEAARLTAIFGPWEHDTGVRDTLSPPLQIAQAALAAVKTRVAGAYVMPPFNRVDSALAVLECVRDIWKPPGGRAS